MDGKLEDINDYKNIETYISATAAKVPGELAAELIKVKNLPHFLVAYNLCTISYWSIRILAICCLCIVIFAIFINDCIFTSGMLHQNTFYFTFSLISLLYFLLGRCHMRCSTCIIQTGLLRSLSISCRDGWQT